MGRIHVLSETVANQIAAGEVVERPASVVKEMLENSLDAGATRIKISVEAGGKKLIQITDNGCGMVRDDAMLAFERHATSKIKNAEDLLSVATLGFRGEALPSIASVSPPASGDPRRGRAAGTVVEINGGKIVRVEEAGFPLGTSITVRDLFFNVPARKKFLEGGVDRAVAHRVAGHALRAGASRQAFRTALRHQRHAGRASGGRIQRARLPGLRQRNARPVDSRGGAAAAGAHRIAAASSVAQSEGMWRGRPRPRDVGQRRTRDHEPESFGEMRLHGFVSKPEIQKLNRNSIFVFVNGRLIRDRLVQHALTEAYRNIIPPTVYPVVLLFLELPAAEVDVNVHPSKTEVRFRQQSVMHDFVRDSVRAALMKARPVPQFMTEIRAHATASPSLTPGAVAGNRRREMPGFQLPAFVFRKPDGKTPEARCFRWIRPASPGSAADYPALSIRRRNRRRGECRDLRRSRPWKSIPDNGCAPALDVDARKSRPCRRWARSSRWDRFAIRSSWR